MLVNSNMTTIDKAKPLVPFLFMGCWNEDDSPRVSVAKAIMKNPIANFPVIANCKSYCLIYNYKNK